MDSSVLLAIMKSEGLDLLPLHVNYGQRSESQEWKACRTICALLGIREPERFNLQDLGRIPSGLTDARMDIDYAFFPTRNLLLLTIGAAVAYSRNIEMVAIGLIRGAVFPDQTADFVRQAERTISRAIARQINIVAPLIELDKPDILLLGREYKVPTEETYSCYVGSETPCGSCAACIERKMAEEALGAAEADVVRYRGGRSIRITIPGA